MKQYSNKYRVNCPRITHDLPIKIMGFSRGVAEMAVFLFILVCKNN